MSSATSTAIRDGPRLPGPSVRIGGVVMGKYLVAWLLGVPAVVVVVAYLFFN